MNNILQIRKDLTEYAKDWRDRAASIDPITKTLTNLDQLERDYILIAKKDVPEGLDATRFNRAVCFLALGLDEDIYDAVVFILCIRAVKACRGDHS